VSPTQPGQGEALAVWAMWAATALAVLVTYSWVDAGDLYNVSREGLGGGLSRSVVLFNYPIAFVAVATALVAMAVLPRRAWLAAAPAIALSALVPFVVDEDDLDVRPANAIPALGVAVAALLTIVAARRAGAGFAPRQPGDPVRVVVAVLVLLVSLPWITASLGLHVTGDLFMGEERFPENDGSLLAAVHLGHHHGLDGSLLVITALLLSRVRIPQRWLGVALTAYLGLMLAYGALNLVQDFWLEQVVKRGWTDESIPSAIVPSVSPVWAVVVALAVVSALVLAFEPRAERRVRPSYSAP
jgi:hypothetical protein